MWAMSCAHNKQACNDSVGAEAAAGGLNACHLMQGRQALPCNMATVRQQPICLPLAALPTPVRSAQVQGAYQASGASTSASVVLAPEGAPGAGAAPTTVAAMSAVSGASARGSAARTAAAA